MPSTTAVKPALLTPNQRVILAAILGSGWCAKRANPVTPDRAWVVGATYFSEDTAKVLLKVRFIRAEDDLRTAAGITYARKYTITPNGRRYLDAAATASAARPGK